MQEENQPTRYALSFEEGTTFKDHYQRNNKNGGKKHIRCFPSCSPNHQKKTACSVPLIVNCKVEMHPNENTAKRPALIAFGCFSLFEFPPDFLRGVITRQKNSSSLISAEAAEASEASVAVNYNGVQIEDIVNIRAVQALVHSTVPPEKGLNPLFTSEALSVCQLEGPKTGFEVKFGFRESAWHYGWTGTRYASLIKHCFRVYVLRLLDPIPENHRGWKIPDNGTEVFAECVGVIASPPFSITCNRTTAQERNGRKGAELEQGSIENISSGKLDQSFQSNQGTKRKSRDGEKDSGTDKVDPDENHSQKLQKVNSSSSTETISSEENPGKELEEAI